VQNVKIITSGSVSAPTINGGHHHCTGTNGNNEYGGIGEGINTKSTTLNGPTNINQENTNCIVNNSTNTMLSIASHTNATTINSINTSMAPPSMVPMSQPPPLLMSLAGNIGHHVCATVSFMDIKSASKAHTAEHKFDDRLLTTEYYEPTSLLNNDAMNLSGNPNKTLTAINCLNDMKNMGNLMPGVGGGQGGGGMIGGGPMNLICDIRRFTPSHGLVFQLIKKTFWQH
jgi:hypothetical protein